MAKQKIIFTPAKSKPSKGTITFTMKPQVKPQVKPTYELKFAPANTVAAKRVKKIYG